MIRTTTTDLYIQNWISEKTTAVIVEISWTYRDAIESQGHKNFADQAKMTFSKSSSNAPELN